MPCGVQTCEKTRRCVNKYQREVAMRVDVRLRKMSISKAFRAVFAKLPPHMVDNIRKWADNHLALSTMFSDDTQRPVLVGLHNRARNTSSFARMAARK